ncbi:MAG: hypothetical protein GY768_01370 [Planctomycetaceae bacterium]|nr:hypothetical protein [Planctomycetaceae bacterium]
MRLNRLADREHFCGKGVLSAGDAGFRFYLLWQGILPYHHISASFRVRDG